MATIDYPKPQGLLNTKSFGFSQIVSAQGSKMIFISGQVGIDAEGKLVGKGDLRAQTEQVFKNLSAALASASASFEDVVKMTYFVVDFSPDKREAISPVRDAHVSQENPPASTLIGVQALAAPDFLIEVEAIAVVG